MRNHSTKRNNRTIILGASISIILLLAIIGSILYKTEQLNYAEEPIVEQEIPIKNTNEEAPLEVEKQATETEGTEIEEAPAAEVEKPVEKVPETEKPVEKVPSVTAAEQQKPIVFDGGYIEGQKPATEPTYIHGILITNKKYPLPATYNKGEDPAAKAALNEMVAAAKLENIELVAFSGFRSYEYQTTLYNNYVKRDGQAEADRYSARPGYSEHQTGLSYDIGEKGREDLWLTSAFGETPAGKWLVNNAHKHGFILRYPRGKEDITGFMYESWHFRYLGVDIAQKVQASGVTLEEYLGIN